MKEITKYIANDGKEFEDEDECRDYERKIMVIKGFIGYDCNGKILDPKDYCFYDWINEICYLRITDITGWNKFEEYCNNEEVFFDQGLENISENGLYFFDEDLGRWSSWDELYSKLDAIRKIMG